MTEYPKCSKCGQYKREGERCQFCQRLAKYGITVDDFMELWEAQDGKCAICGHKPSGTWPDVLCIDHDHQYQAFTFVRGLLCRQCNNGLGHFRDDVDLLRRAITYLEVQNNFVTGMRRSQREPQEEPRASTIVWKGCTTAEIGALLDQLIPAQRSDHA